MKRIHTVTVEFKVEGDEEPFDPSNYYNYVNDVATQRIAADIVISSVPKALCGTVADTDTELVLTEAEKAEQAAYHKAEDLDYSTRANALEALGEAREIKYTIFSMSEVAVEEMNNPLGLSSSFGPIRFIQEGGSFFGDEESADYKSDVVVNPTMMDAWKAFDDSIEVTRDNHHIFLEGLQPVEMDKDGVLSVTFVTGS